MAEPGAAGVVVIGVGNALRHDDAAGLEVARRVAARAPGIAVREQEGEPLGLLEQWRGAAAALVVDALRSGASPGTVSRLDLSERPLPAPLPGSTSTHAIGLGEAIELARALGRLPPLLVLYGIEGRCFTAGRGLCREVSDAVAAVTDAVLSEALRLAG